MTFKTKMDRLESIAAALEQDEIDLEKSIELYEEGTQLIKECEMILNDTKQKVMFLNKNDEEQPFLRKEEINE